MSFIIDSRSRRMATQTDRRRVDDHRAATCVRWWTAINFHRRGTIESRGAEKCMPMPFIKLTIDKGSQPQSYSQSVSGAARTKNRPKHPVCLSVCLRQKCQPSIIEPLSRMAGNIQRQQWELSGPLQQKQRCSNFVSWLSLSFRYKLSPRVLPLHLLWTM